MREDYKIISEIIEPGSKVLDLGCGDGELMALLTKEKNARAQGIELDDAQNDDLNSQNSLANSFFDLQLNRVSYDKTVGRKVWR